MKLIITGCGRSGTHYLANLLKKAGIKAAHEEEALGHDGPKPICSELDAVVSWCALPYLDQFPGAVVVHLIRHPISVATSLRNIGLFKNQGGHNRMVANYMPFGDNIPELDHWIDWNTWAHNEACRTIKLESICFGDLFWLGKVCEVEIGETFPVMSAMKERHHGGSYSQPQKFDLNNYERLDELVALADHYGYNLGFKGVKYA